MKYIIFFSVLLVFCFTFSVCKKDDPGCPPDLPCATQTGENTFGCYIDGEPWVAKVEPYVLDPSAHKLEVSYDETGYAGFNSNSTKIKAMYYSNDGLSYLAMLFQPLKGEGEIRFTKLTFLDIEFRKPGRSYSIDTTFQHAIHITKLDTIKNVLSGSFFFTVTRSDDTITITDGRFDVIYYPE